MMDIYRIRNTTDGYRYDGNALDIERRWEWHRKRLARGNHPTRF